MAYRVMRVDTAINAGNSGGGLYNASGNLIGLVEAKASSSSIDNISYAIPANIVRGVADNVIRHSKAGKDKTSAFEKRMIGISTQSSDSSNRYDAEKGTITVTETVYVAKVVKNSSAAAVGLAVGDVIKSARLLTSDGVTPKSVRGSTEPLTITRNFQLSDYMMYADAGDKVELTVVRDGKEEIIAVTV